LLWFIFPHSTQFLLFFILILFLFQFFLIFHRLFYTIKH
jgi:hypothetical protein